MFIRSSSRVAELHRSENGVTKARHRAVLRIDPYGLQEPWRRGRGEPGFWSFGDQRDGKDTDLSVS